MTILQDTVVYIRKYQYRADRPVVYKTKQSSSGATRKVVEFHYKDGGVLDYVKSLYNTTDRNVMKRAITATIGKYMLQAMKGEAYRFKDTRNLVDSLRVEQTRDGTVHVDSDSPYKNTWLDNEDQGIPPISRLAPWVKRQADLTTGDKKKDRRIAFAIQRSFATGAGEGSTGNSTLRKLNPGGKRFYDFPQVALEEIKPEIEELGQLFKELQK